jgi:hypothetical protein
VDPVPAPAAVAEPAQDLPVRLLRGAAGFGTYKAWKSLADFWTAVCPFEAVEWIPKTDCKIPDAASLTIESVELRDVEMGDYLEAGYCLRFVASRDSDSDSESCLFETEAFKPEDVALSTDIVKQDYGGSYICLGALLPWGSGVASKP